MLTSSISTARAPAPSFALLALVAVLSSCASPSPQMSGGEKYTTEVGGSRFTIWHMGEAVEIYRTSPEMLPRLSEVMAKAEIAVTNTTGCRVKKGSLVGDAALMKAKLACG